MSKEKFMLDAIQLSIENIKVGGGPFGAIIVKNGVIVSSAANSVTRDNDPTAHAEVNAIRKACKSLGTYDLSDCEIYTSCEPCPMCLGAIYWSHIGKVYYANNKKDAKNIGFDDSFIYDELALPIDKRKIQFKQLNAADAIKAFETWETIDNKIAY